MSFQSPLFTHLKKKVQVMGILNVTPDSFSDGGRYHALDRALKHAETLLQEGADWIDIGGESTRPNAAIVSEQEELDRVLPVIEAMTARFDCAISIDTSKPKVMQAAYCAGVKMINDVRSLRLEGALEMAATLPIPICLMHMIGTPQTMQTLADCYDKPIEQEVHSFLAAQIQRCIQAGIDRSRLILDPGFGFGKSVSDNYRLLGHLSALSAFDLPILIGVSRKSMIGNVLQVDPQDRLIGSVAAAMLAALNGADFLRVHDVKATAQALKIVEMTRNGYNG